MQSIMTPEQWKALQFEEDVRGIIVGPHCKHRVFVCHFDIIPGVPGTHKVRCDHCETDEEAVAWIAAEYPEYYVAGAEMRVYE